jgi:hypothetical protein
MEIIVPLALLLVFREKLMGKQKIRVLPGFLDLLGDQFWDKYLNFGLFY